MLKYFQHSLDHYAYMYTHTRTHTHTFFQEKKKTCTISIKLLPLRRTAKALIQFILTRNEICPMLTNTQLLLNLL